MHCTEESTCPFHGCEGRGGLCSYHNLRRHPAPQGGFRACLEQKFGAEKVRKLPDGALGLLESMLRLDPKKRISAYGAFKVGPQQMLPCAAIAVGADAAPQPAQAQ